MAGFEENEISINSVGGTEMVKRAIAERMPAGLADDFQIICSRVRDIQEDKIRVYWVHDTHHDPETNHLRHEISRERFHKIVFCSNWQYNQYMLGLDIPITNQFTVIETPISPLVWKEKPKDEIRLIYTSTPQRGLSILVPVFEKLCEKYDNIHLDVFSSYKIYGWDHADAQFEELFQKCKDHPKITYHGARPNDEVRQALEQSHIFAYPSIWPECNSRSLIEAMSAGLLCIHPNLAGLSDTSGGLTTMYQWDTDMNRHANLFYQILDHSISVVHQDNLQNYLRFVKTYADQRFNIDKISNQWKLLLENLKMQYPAENRNISLPTFRYST